MAYELIDDSELDIVIQQLCASKAEEFQLLGYEHVTAKEIWNCIQDRYVKKEMPALHRLVNDILSLKVPQFMNYLTLAAMKGSPF